MRHSYVEVYLHVVWHTKCNRPLLKGRLKQFVHHEIREFGSQLGLHVLAVNSAWNHTHSLYGWHPSLCIDDTVGQIKSRISRIWNKALADGTEVGPRLEWQVGYGAVSIRRSEIPKITAYIENQKHHHARNTLDPDLEVSSAPNTVERNP